MDPSRCPRMLIQLHIQRWFSVPQELGRCHPERVPHPPVWRNQRPETLRTTRRPSPWTGLAVWLFCNVLWKQLTVEKCCHFFKPRKVPPPRLEPNTQLINLHLRFFLKYSPSPSLPNTIHHHPPFPRVTVQSFRLRREGKQCRSCLRAQWANPSDAEPPVAFAEAGGSRGKDETPRVNKKNAKLLFSRHFGKQKIVGSRRCF